MTTSRAFLAMLSTAVLIMGGCQSEPASMEPIDEATTSQSGQLLPGYEQVVGGDLARVDLEAGTFTLMVADAAQTFRFTDATDVTGTAGTQGLAGSEGARATVHYRDEQGERIAVRIVLE
jgi:hypothetical protein